MSDVLVTSGLQAIPLADGQYLLKRGLSEIVVGGVDGPSVIEPLVQLIDGTRTERDLLAAFPATVRANLELILQALVRRGFVTRGPARCEADATGPADAGTARQAQEAFYANFGPAGARAKDRLRDARVAVVGLNQLSRRLVGRLIECGVREVTVFDHPILRDGPDAAASFAAACAPPPAPHPPRVRTIDALFGGAALEGIHLVCTACDYGQPGALLEVSRLALRVRVPHLAVWLSEMIGTVGPLCIPAETACLRCFLLRTDANDPRLHVTRGKRHFALEHPDAARAIGFLPQMPGIVGEVAAMEAVKFLGGFTPSDAVGRVIETNLVSHGSVVRRVLKVPRCPDCGARTRSAPPALLRGPPIERVP